MSMTSNEVAQAYAKGEAPGHGLSADGRVAYSYAEPIAVKLPERLGRVAVVTTDKWSVTTSKHVSKIRHALKDAGYELIELSFVEFCRDHVGTKAAVLCAATPKELLAFAKKHVGDGRKPVSRHSEDSERARAYATPAGKRRLRETKKTMEFIAEASAVTHREIRALDAAAVAATGAKEKSNG